MKQCLIVDDSEIIRKVARHFIEQLNLEVHEAETGREALDHCKARMPDIILLDWILPDMKVAEFIAALRLHAGRRHPIVLYFTTEYDPADISRAFSAGADDFLMKPFDREAITAKFSALGLAA